MITIRGTESDFRPSEIRDGGVDPNIGGALYPDGTFVKFTFPEASHLLEKTGDKVTRQRFSPRVSRFIGAGVLAGALVLTPAAFKGMEVGATLAGDFLIDTAQYIHQGMEDGFADLARAGR